MIFLGPCTRDLVEINLRRNERYQERVPGASGVMLMSSPCAGTERTVIAWSACFRQISRGMVDKVGIGV